MADSQPNLESLSLQGEEWRQIPGCDKYFVSNIGRVISTFKDVPSILKGGLSTTGYKICTIGRYAKSKPVHHMVAEAFIGPRPIGFQINHIDGCKTNNSVSNLEYVTPSDNALHAFKLGLSKPSPLIGESNPRAKLTKSQADEIRYRYVSENIQKVQLAKHYGVTRKVIHNILQGSSYRPSINVFNDSIPSRPRIGQSKPSSKMTWDKVTQMRSDRIAGESYGSLAEKYGVCYGTVWHICKMRTWQCQPKEKV